MLSFTNYMSCLLLTSSTIMSTKEVEAQQKQLQYRMTTEEAAEWGGLFGECFHGDCWFPWDHTVFCGWALPKAHHVLACLFWLTSHHDLARTHKVSFINFRGFYKQTARSCLISTWATSSLRIWMEFSKHPCLSRLHPASRSRDETLSNWGSHYGASNPH